MNLTQQEGLEPRGWKPELGTLNVSERARAFLSLAEGAQEINCTRRFLEKRIEDGEIRVFRPSRRLVRIKRSEFDRWIESFSTRGGGDTANRGGEK